MRNSGETKNEWILRELNAVKEKYKNKKYDTFEVNVSLMAADCIDVINDLEREIQILQLEISKKDDPTITLEKLRADLRGDICE